MLFKVPQCSIRSTVQRSRLTARPPSRECTSSLSTKNQTGLSGRRTARLDIGSIHSTPWNHDREQQLPKTNKKHKTKKKQKRTTKNKNKKKNKRKKTQNALPSKEMCHLTLL